MNTRNPTLTAAILLVVAMPAARAGAANDPGAEFDGHANAGYRYDSNVGIPELDSNTGNGDHARLLEAGLETALPLGNNLSLDLGYNYSQTAYRQYDEYDLALHRLNSELAWHKSGTTAAVAARHFAARLDGERFLDVAQVSPSIAHLFAERLYLRGAYTASHKTFATDDQRDANNDAIDVDGYWLIDGMQHYVSLGARTDTEDATGDQFDYRGQRLSLGWGRHFDVLPRGLATKAKLQYEDRDYDHVTPAIDAVRHDRRRQASIAASVPLTDWLSIETEARFTDSASNLPAANRDETRWSVSFAAAF